NQILAFYETFGLIAKWYCRLVGPVRADIAQVVEHFHGKEKVASASLAIGSSGMNAISFLMKDKTQTENRIKEIEAAMMAADFWSDKNRAQGMIKELQDLKDELLGFSKYDKKDAVLNI